MITGAQMRAARALLGIDQKTLADLAGLSVPTIQRMEASSGNVRGVVDSLTRVVEALDRAGIELIGEEISSQGKGRACACVSGPACRRPNSRSPRQPVISTTPELLS
jgi:transcriptional regulator with XRE-family HTH domain